MAAGTEVNDTSARKLPSPPTSRHHGGSMRVLASFTSVPATFAGEAGTTAARLLRRVRVCACLGLH